MTLREYFTKHPDFRSTGELHVIDPYILTFCGVPFNLDLWDLLKLNRLDEEIPDATLTELRAYSSGAPSIGTNDAGA